MTRRARIEGHRDPVVRLALMRPKSSGGTVTNVTGTDPPIHVTTSGTVKNVALVPPGQAFATNGAPIAITNAFAALLNANITPEVTGKVDVFYSATVENADSANTHFFSLEIATGLGVAIAPDAISVPPSVLGTPGKANVSGFVSLDQAPTNPVTFSPLGTLANISVAGKADVNGQLSIIAESVVLKSQERYA